MVRLTWSSVGKWVARAAGLVAIALAPVTAFAQTQNLNLAWNANPEPDIASYYVHVGTSSGNYNIAVTPVPSNQQTYAFPATPGVRYYFAVRAVNAAGAWSPSSTEVVGGVPTFAQPANQAGLVGTLITPLQLSAADPDGGALQFSASNLPAGLSMSASGRITGIPLSVQTRNVTVSVFDGTVTVQRSFTWTINPASAAVSAVSSTPSSGTGLTQTFTLVYSDSLGAVDLATAAVRFSATSSATANTCYLSYNRASGLMSLMDDGGSSWQSASLGTGTLSNSQCSLALANSTAVASGVNLTMTLAMTFKSGYTGAKNIYMHAVSTGGNQTAWTDRGNWTVPPLTLGLTSNLAAPRPTGTSIAFTATANGGVAPYQFKWLLYNGASWSTLRDWGGATLTWTPTAANSAYRIGVWVRDATMSGDVATFNLSIPYAITAPVSAPFALTSITPSLSSPRAAHTSITFTASASGGTGPYQYKWWLFDGANWTMVQNWSGNALTWTPTVPSSDYRIGVWARDATTTADVNTYNLSVPYVVTAPAAADPLAITGLNANLASPRAAGTTITFTAAVAGGNAPYQFKWWIFDGSTWTMVQNWGGNTFSWRPTAANANYRIGVWARDSTTTADTSAHNLSVPYVITGTTSSAPFAITGLSADVASPSAAGAPVTFTASALGGTAPYQFKWWVFDGVTWTMSQDWGGHTFTWTPTVAGANYRIGIWARDATSSADSNLYNLSVPYQVNAASPSGPLTISALTPSVAIPSVGAPVTFTASAAGGSAPYQFKWWLFDGVTWTIVQNWGGNTFTWTPTVAGANYRIGIWARDATTTADVNTVNLSIAVPVGP